jgi:Lsr2
MTRIVTVVMTDDIDGSPDAQTLRFGYQGQQFEIDLAGKNHAAFLATVQPFIAAARVVPGRRRPRAAARTRRSGGSLSVDRVDRAAVRAWAESQGIRIARRGRIRGDVLERYAAAHEH